MTQLNVFHWFEQNQVTYIFELDQELLQNTAFQRNCQGQSPWIRTLIYNLKIQSKIKSSIRKHLASGSSNKETSNQVHSTWNIPFQTSASPIWLIGVPRTTYIFDQKFWLTKRLVEMVLFNVLIIIAFVLRGTTQNWLPGSSFRLRFNQTIFELRFTTVNLWCEFYPTRHLYFLK